MDVTDDCTKNSILQKSNEDMLSLKLHEMNCQLSEKVIDKNEKKQKQIHYSSSGKGDESIKGSCTTSHEKNKSVNIISNFPTHLDKSKRPSTEEYKLMEHNILFNSSLKIQKSQINDLEEMENIDNYLQNQNTLESKLSLICEEDSLSVHGSTVGSESKAKISDSHKRSLSKKSKDEMNFESFPKLPESKTSPEMLSHPVLNENKVTTSSSIPEANLKKENEGYHLVTKAQKLHTDSLLYYGKNSNEDKLRLMFDFSKIEYLMNEEFPFNKLIDEEHIDWSEVKPLWKKFSVKDLLEEDKSEELDKKYKTKSEKKIKLNFDKSCNESFSTNNCALNNKDKLTKEEIPCSYYNSKSTSLLSKCIDQETKIKEEPASCCNVPFKRKAEVPGNGLEKIQKVSPSKPLHQESFKSYEEYSDDSSDEGGIHLSDLSDDEFSNIQ